MRYALFALTVLAAPLLAAEPKKPNVLFVIADDLNCDLGCYGNKLVQSPHLDKLAAKGVRFDRAYVQYPVCNPSRTSFLTGLRPDTTKVLDNGVNFRTTVPDAVTLPQLFRANGYHAASFGKVFHRGLSPAEEKADMDDRKSWDTQFYGKATAAASKGEGRNLTGGKLKWCEWRAADCDDDDLPDGQITTAAIDAMTKTTDKPWFLAVGYYRPHDPFVSPKKYFDAYPLDKMEIPKSPDGYTLPYPHTLPGGEFRTAFDQFTDADKREFLRSYYAGVSHVDAQVGRLMGAMDRLKLWDNTVVVFIGDHGYELGVRNWWNKATLFERSCRAPFLVYAPGMKGNGKATTGLTEFTDLYPTLAELCGLKDTPKGLEGASFANRLNDPAAAGKQAANTIVKRGNANLGRSVRTDRYRYTEWDGGKKGAELYDHTTDPGEWKNLAADAALKDVVTTHQKLLANAVREMNARWWLCIPPLVAFTADVTATLLGQPAEYSAGEYGQVIEGNPVARWLLVLSPWLAVWAGVVWAAVFILVVRYWRFGHVAAFLLTAGHTVGVSMWLIRLGWPGWVGGVVMFVVMERIWTWCRRLSPSAL